MKKITNIVLLSLLMFGCNSKTSSSESSKISSSSNNSSSIISNTSSSSSTHYVDYNVDEELINIVGRTLKKDEPYFNKEDIQEVNISSEGYTLSSLSNPGYGFLIVNKDGKSGVYSLFTNSVIFEPKVNSKNVTLAYMKNVDIGFFLLIFDSTTGEYDVIDAFGNLISSGSNYTTVSLNKLETLKKDDTFYLVDNLSNTTKYYKYNEDGSLTDISFIEGNKSVNMSIFDQYSKLIDLKEYGNEDYYLAISYQGNKDVYDFYNGSEKYFSYQFGSTDSINIVGNKIIAKKYNEESITSINYVSGEIEQLNIGVDILFKEGKSYKDENGIYKYFANAYYLMEEDNIKYVYYLMDEDCNVLFEVEHINLLRLEYFDGVYFDAFNKIFVDNKLNVTSEIINDKYDFYVRGELLLYSTSNGKGAMDSTGKVVMEYDNNTYIHSDPVNGYLYLYRNTEFYRYNYLTGEEEKTNYTNFNEVYGNLYVAETQSGRVLVNEKETICSASSLSDCEIINANFKNKKIFYFAESTIGGNNKGKFLYLEIK